MLASSSRATAFTGRTLTSSRALVLSAPKRALVVENAHKKGAGSTKNGRDSNSKRRGVKQYGGQPIKAGAIIVRQLGSTVSCGNGVRGANERGVGKGGGAGLHGRRRRRRRRRRQRLAAATGDLLQFC